MNIYYIFLTVRCLGNECEFGDCVSPGTVDYAAGMSYRCICQQGYTGLFCNVEKGRIMLK